MHDFRGAEGTDNLKEREAAIDGGTRSAQERNFYRQPVSRGAGGEPGFAFHRPFAL